MLNKLPKDLLKYINEFIEPTEEQLEYWKICHYIDYYKVLNDIQDTIIEIKIDKNGEMSCYFSLFSWSLLQTDFNNYLSTDEESDDNRSLVML